MQEIHRPHEENQQKSKQNPQRHLVVNFCTKITYFFFSLQQSLGVFRKFLRDGSPHFIAEQVRETCSSKFHY